MAIKIDLEKAFDKLEWSFIYYMLRFMNVPLSLIQIIMACITSASSAILINGTPESFLPSRGERQGDPLSPYLFILCLEYLSLQIENAVQIKKWNPFALNKSKLKIFHCFFADDLVLFAKTEVKNASSIVSILNGFSKISQD